ncbi:diguanylate cyclase [Guyparkeria halopsychrophila]|uniref:sensor domain-containing diguanylate cyclase n=1 Tax=Guyparkeria halopsychrophila TaxID=3139421 RepID=UPI0037C90D39
MFRRSTKQSAEAPACPLGNHWLLAMTLSLTLLGAAGGYLWGANAVMQQADEKAAQLARQWSPALSAFFSRHAVLPQALELLPRIQSTPTAASPASANPFLSQLAERFDLDSLYVIRPSGTTVASSTESFIGENYAFRPYFQNAMDGRTTIYAALGSTSSEPGYYVAGPIRADDRIAGVLAIKVRSSSIGELLPPEADSVDWALSDEHGVIFAASRDEWLLQSRHPLSTTTLERLNEERRYPGIDPAVMPTPYQTRPETDAHPLLMLPANYVGVATTPISGTNWRLTFFTSTRTSATFALIYAALGGIIVLAISLTGVVLALREANRSQMLRTAVRDPLTGLFTRLYMKEAIPPLVAMHVRHPDQGFTMVMLDIDHFKRVNDHHGHLAGDRVLAHIGKIVREQIRAGDIPVRYGGEELAVFLPGEGLEEARQCAERIRQAVEKTEIRAGHSMLSVTISAGVAVHRQEESLSAIIGRADRELYCAKQSGRNRVCIEGTADTRPG